MNPQNTLIYEIQRLKKAYRGRTVLNIGRLQIHRGTINGLIGTIGAGKTSLLRILAGVDKPSEGSLKYDNREFETNWRGRIVPPPEIYFTSAETLTANRRVWQLIRAVHPGEVDRIKSKYFQSGYRKTFWDSVVGDLSPGEAAWVNMVLAVESDPRVLLIDNYATLFDTELEGDFRARLKKMNRSLGTTIILATPTDFHVKRFASVLVYLDNGHIAKIRSGAGGRDGDLRGGRGREGRRGNR